MSYQRLFRHIFLVVLIWSAVSAAKAQVPLNNMGLRPGLDTTVSYDSQGRPIRKQRGGNDSLQHRDPLEDSITISFRYFDSTRTRRLDSSINDFRSRYPFPWYYQDLGNDGTAARSLLFAPNAKAGFDPGFHAYDVYKFRIEDSRFFQTTRPYTELAYLLGSKGEQFINILHTQNRKPNFNFTFEYRLLNSPGSFKNQNTNHNNVRVNTYYQSKNKRYTSYFIFILNKIRSGENGGVQDDKRLDSLTGQSLSDPFSLNTRLGVHASNVRNPFNSSFKAGTSYDENTLMYRHMYDFGQKDSIVTDSSVIRLFYPRFRFQHTLKYSKSKFMFSDYDVVDSNYQNYFNIPAVTGDTIRYQDSWRDITNEFAIISYPEKNNLNQFLKLGAGWQNLQGEFTYYNGDSVFGLKQNSIYVSGEYRNRTRNQKWDMEASGQLYAAGPYAGDYAALISLKSLISKKIGYLELGFQNINHTPSFIYDTRSAFPSLPDGSFKKENITRLFANIEIPRLQLKLTGDYYLATNYAYFDSFLVAKQDGSLFNVLHIGAEKKFRLSKYWNWYSELHLQQKTGNAPVNIPGVLTRNRLVFEGNFFKNLFLATGLELRYYTAYKAANYSPFTGQFFYQDSYTISNRPDIDVFLHFRIKSFKGFIRLENLNSFNVANGSVGFAKYNFAAPHYATRTMWLRFGIWWNFVN
jgi:hypothetical protein